MYRNLLVTSSCFRSHLNIEFWRWGFSGIKQLDRSNEGPRSTICHTVVLICFQFYCSQKVFFVRLSFLLPPLSGDLAAALRVDEAVRPAAEGQAGVLGLDPSMYKFMCFQLSTCGSFVKKLGVRSLLFFSVYCGLCFKWDANVIYSACMRHLARTGLSKAMQTGAGKGCVWAACPCWGGVGRKEQSPVTRSETGE